MTDRVIFQKLAHSLYIGMGGIGLLQFSYIHCFLLFSRHRPPIERLPKQIRCKNTQIIFSFDLSASMFSEIIFPFSACISFPFLLHRPVYRGMRCNFSPPILKIQPAQSIFRRYVTQSLSPACGHVCQSLVCLSQELGQTDQDWKTLILPASANFTLHTSEVFCQWFECFLPMFEAGVAEG